MIKASLLILGMLFFANELITAPNLAKDAISAPISLEILEDIRVMNGIINLKLAKAAQLEIQGKQLLKFNANSHEGLSLLEDARLQRLMTLKYKAAIACKTR